MKDLAIHLQKVVIDENKCIFKPVNVIRGDYNEESDLFITESGLVCENIRYDEYEDDNYYDSLTTIEELKKVYGSNIPEDTLLTQFFDASKEQLYVGLNNGNGTFDIIKIPDGELDEMLMEQSEGKVVLTKKAIEELKDCKDMDELREKLSFVSFASQISSDSTIFFDSEDLECNEEEEEPKEAKKKQGKLAKKDSKKYDYKKLYDIVLSKIVAQDEAVNKIVTRIAMNQMASNPMNKSNILIAGPTGTGKTEMIKIICENLDIPCYKVNATDYTQEGYVGMDVSQMIQGLINACDGDVEKAEKGILIIDEIDKKASGNNAYEASNKGVLDSLLKITGKDIMQVELGRGISKEVISFDTSNLTVVFLGAFAGIDEIVNPKKTIGFAKNAEKDEKKLKLVPKDFIKYGLTPELVGRIGCIVQTKPFGLEDYVQIIYKSDNSPLKLKKEMYEKDLKIKFYYTNAYVRAMAQKAMEINEGARGLNNAITETLESIDEDIIKKGMKPKLLKLTKATANDSKKYYIE